MTYCLHHYSIPLFWRWQRVHGSPMGLPQTVGEWHIHLGYSQHHFRRPNHPGSRWVAGMCTSMDWEARLLGDHCVLFTLALVPAVPHQAPQASWCCANCTARAGTSTGCWVESCTCSEANRGVRGLCTWVRSAHTHTPWHPCAGHLLVKTVMKTCHCSAICSSS